MIHDEEIGGTIDGTKYRLSKCDGCLRDRQVTWAIGQKMVCEYCAGRKQGDMSLRWFDERLAAGLFIVAMVVIVIVSLLLV